MKISDFVLDEVDSKNGEYWFRIYGESQTEIEDMCWERAVRRVDRVVININNGAIGAERIFVYDKDVVLIEDRVLQQILLRLVKSPGRH